MTSTAGGALQSLLRRGTGAVLRSAVGPRRVHVPRALPPGRGRGQHPGERDPRQRLPRRRQGLSVRRSRALAAGALRRRPAAARLTGRPPPLTGEICVLRSTLRVADALAVGG